MASQMFLLIGVDYNDVLNVPRFLLTNLKHQFLQLQRKLSIAVSDRMIGVALWS